MSAGLLTENANIASQIETYGYRLLQTKHFTTKEKELEVSTP